MFITSVGKKKKNRINDAATLVLSHYGVGHRTTTTPHGVCFTPARGQKNISCLGLRNTFRKSPTRNICYLNFGWLSTTSYKALVCSGIRSRSIQLMNIKRNNLQGVLTLAKLLLRLYCFTRKLSEHLKVGIKSVNRSICVHVDSCTHTHTQHTLDVRGFNVKEYVNA